jgi:phosphatidyl-myo-inositol alpha-mannosyltransferase
VQQVVMSIFDDMENPHYAGGGAIVVHEVASRLARHYQVVVYCASYRGSRSRPRWRGPVRYVFLPVGWAGPRGGQLLFQLVVPLVALVHRPLVWIETLTPPFSVSLLPLLSRSPVVALVQMLSATDMARKYKLPFPLVERRGLGLYGHFIVLNKVDQMTIQRYCRRASCTVIPNGTTRAPVADSEFGHGDHILFLGRIDVRQKGLDMLLAAIRQHPPGLPLVVAGSGSRREEQKLRELSAGAGPAVRWVGRIGGSEKEKLLRTCAFVVVPSRFETFSLSALEGMTHGKPVVCFDLPQLEWIGAECAVRVAPFDVAALGRAIQDLAGEPQRRAALGRAAYDASQEYDWDRIVERYRGVLTAAATDAHRHCSAR